MTIPSSNPQTFGWIKSALDQSMQQAMGGLEAAAESEDLKKLQSVSRDLHQIQGALQMVELEAASILAEDLEVLTARLTDSELNPDSNIAVQILRTGLDHLKRYLGAIESQNPQSPLILLDDINAVRSKIGKPKITQYDLFDPTLDLDLGVASNDILSFPPEKRQNVLYHLRKRFRQALLSWLNDRDKEHALEVLQDLMLNLNRIGGPSVLQQLWWVAAGFIESIKKGEIESNAEIKAHFAELDAELSRMREDRLGDIVSSPPDELIRHMLFDIGVALSNENQREANQDDEGRAAEIRNLVDLHKWFIFDKKSVFTDQFTELADRIKELAQEITHADFARLENRLDAYFSGGLDNSETSEFFDDLDKLVEVTSDEKYGKLVDFVDVFRDSIKSANLTSESLFASGSDIKIASSLLMFEETLRSPGSVNEQWQQSLQSHIDELANLADVQGRDQSVAFTQESQQAQLEFSGARDAVVVEIKRYLGEVENIISSHKGTASENEFPSFGRKLFEIGNLFAFLEQSRVAELTTQVVESTKKLAQDGEEISAHAKETLAFIVASVGVSADMISQGNSHIDSVVERAYEMLEKLDQEPALEIKDEGSSHVEIETSLDGDAESDFTELENSISAVSAQMGSETDIESLELPTGEMIEHLESVIDEIGSFDEDIHSVLNQIEIVQARIVDEDDVSGDLLHLILLFNSIQDGHQELINPESKKLASMASRLLSKVSQNEIALSPEAHRYISRVNDQIRDLEKAGRDENNLEAESDDTDADELPDENIEDIADEVPVLSADTEQEVHHIENVYDHRYIAAELDAELSAVFADDLTRLSNLLSESRDFFLIAARDGGYDPKVLKENCETVSRVVHTLTGNFNSVGLTGLGDVLVAAKPYLTIDRAETPVLSMYGSTLDAFAASLDKIAAEISVSDLISVDSQAQISDAVSGFRRISSLFVKHTIPLVVEDDASDRDDDEDIDFAIGDADDIEDVQINCDEIDDQVESSQPDSLGDKNDNSDKDELDVRMVHGTDEEMDQVGGQVEEAEEQSESDDDFDIELKEIFIEESRILLSRMNSFLTEWRTDGYDDEILAGIRREFHTLKGSAAATGFDEISLLSHNVESLLERDDGNIADDGDAMLNLLEEMHDGLASELGFIPGRNEGHMRSLISMVELLLSGKEAIKEAEALAEDTASGLEEQDENEKTTHQLDDISISDDQIDGFQSEGLAADIEEVEETDVTKGLSGEEEVEVVEINEQDAATDASAEDDFDIELKEIFIEESRILLSRMNSFLTEWRTDGYDDEILAGIRREFHTLKGSAAATGFDEISLLSHNVESLLERDDGNIADDGDAMLNLLEEMHDGLASELGFIPGRNEGHMRSLISMVELLLSGKEAIKEAEALAEDTASGLEEQDENEKTTHQLDDISISDDQIDGFQSEGLAADIEEVEEVEETDVTKGLSGEEEVEVVEINEQDAATDVSAEDTVEESVKDVAENVKDLLSLQQASSMEPVEVDMQAKDAEQTAETDGDLIDDSSAMASAETETETDQDAALEVSNSKRQVSSTPEPAEPSVSVDSQTIAKPVVRTAAAESTAATMRIDNKKLTDLLNYSGELGLTRTQLKTTLDSTRNELGVLRDSMKTIREGLRDLEFEADAQMRAMPESQSTEADDEDFDPLQLDRYSRLQARAREVNQQLDDLSRVERQLSERASELGGALVRQFHLGEQLQDGLINARMASINEYLPRFRQLVRETSRRVGKPVDFSSQGGDIEVDRQVMDSMVAPFEHMIRNSVIHGIEEAAVRTGAKKPANGNVDLSVTQQGSELLISFSDDGAGLKKAVLQKRAVDLGLIRQSDEISDDILLQVITEPGFSTADRVSMESGRGVGMDVVLQAVRSLGGSMSVSSTPEKGTAFQFRLPVTMTISQALLVHVGSYRFAILTRTIERVMKVRDADISEINGEGHVVVDGESLPIINLADRLGQTSLSTDEVYRSIILIRMANRVAAFEVDQFDETVEIVSKTPGRQLTSIAGISGVTVLADTSIVLIINPGEYLDRQISALPHADLLFAGDDKSASEMDNELESIDLLSIIQTVLVVDDSLVVRKVMQRDMEGLGLDVVAAVDGVNALQVIDEQPVDIALVDLEMPRMNGYELLIRLREDEKYKNLPVIVITSRAGDMHRARAMNLGANEYITKPYDVTELEQAMKSVYLRLKQVH